MQKKEKEDMSEQSPFEYKIQKKRNKIDLSPSSYGNVSSITDLTHIDKLYNMIQIRLVFASQIHIKSRQ